MPFTIDGQWVPSKATPAKSASSKPVKVRLIKRGKSILTVILNLNLDSKELTEIASNLKKKLGCGGAVKDGEVEIQGDKVDLTKKYLLEIGIKSQ
ncbi:MAG TPA: hypothetical protein VGP47_09510 [Parachlamydiaceae bacterium]|nr:hypothetical protein [Parachlamydiaceae bacterium]